MPDTIRIADLLLEAVVRAQPSRPPMLMVHGIMGGSWYFAKWLEFFGARGHPAYALNLRGHHGSRPVPDIGRVSVMDYVTDVHDAARDVRERHPGAPLVLVGHSMGGLVAQKAAETLELAGLVLLSAVPPAGIPLLSWPLFRRQLKHVPAMLRSRAIVADPADSAALFLNRVDPVEVASFIPLWQPASGRAGRDITLGRVSVDASRIACPMLVIAGGDDVAIPPRVQRAIARKYGATFRVYDENAHFLIWERGWDRIAADVAAWIEEGQTGAPVRREGIERPHGDPGHAERPTMPTSRGA
jgi:pimeloyl-ACP methyl ester carboxylesterase